MTSQDESAMSASLPHHRHPAAGNGTIWRGGAHEVKSRRQRRGVQSKAVLARRQRTVVQLGHAPPQHVVHIDPLLDAGGHRCRNGDDAIGRVRPHCSRPIVDFKAVVHNWIDTGGTSNPTAALLGMPCYLERDVIEDSFSQSGSLWSSSSWAYRVRARRRWG